MSKRTAIIAAAIWACSCGYATAARAPTDPLVTIFGNPQAFGKITFRGVPMICGQWVFHDQAGGTVRVITECFKAATKKKAKPAPGAA